MTSAPLRLYSLTALLRASLTLGICLTLAACAGDDGDDDQAGDTDGDTSGDTAGDTEGDTAGETEGDTSGETEGDTEGDTEGETGGDEALDIVGDYVDDFMTEHSISETLWTFAGSNFAIDDYDNDAMYVIAQNDEANDFNPGLWSRFDWAWDGDQLYYCQIVFDGETAEDALAVSADAGDLAMGCGGFSWSMLSPL